MKSCFLIGHWDAPITVLPELIQEIERHIMEYGVYDFVVGRYGSFDRLAAIAVSDAKKKRHQQVTLTLLHPYTFDLPLSKSEEFDAVFYPPGMESVPKRLAIVRANQYMIEHSTHLIAYVSHPSVGSRMVFEAALARQKRGLMCVTNIAGRHPY